MKWIPSPDRPRRDRVGIRHAVVLGVVVLLGSVPAEGQGICNRTPQVRDAILEKLGRTDCRQVSSAALSGLTALSLSSSSLRRLRADDFRGMDSLRYLEMDDNHLATLPSGVFSGLSNLRQVAVRRNDLTSLPPDLLRGLSKLEGLSFKDNDLTVLPERLFAGLSSLTFLALDENSLTELSPAAFSGLTKLREVRLLRNELTELPAELFRDLSSLTLLYIGANRLEALPAGLFSGLSELRSLYASDNAIRALASNSFRGAPRLTLISLSGNELSQLPAGVFAGLRSLEALYLSENGLTELPDGVFSGLSSLWYLDLAKNALTDVADSGLFDLANLNTLRLDENPGVPFTVPLVFERGWEGSEREVKIRVRQIARVRNTADVELKPVDGTVSASTVSIGYEEKASDIVTWRPRRAAASVTALPGSGSAGHGWRSGEATIRLDDLPPVTLGSCEGLEEDLAATCLRGGRFLVRVDWRSQYDGSEGVGTMRQLTDESAVATFFDEENVELVFKLLDGRGINRHFWVFYGALSDVEYTLSVTDRETGEFREYRNPPGEICGRGDTMAFSAESGAAALLGSGLPDRAGASQSADCPAGALCLQDGRFQVTATWSNPAKGETGVGTPIPDTDSAGYMWFFSPGNIELVLKVLDGRWLNDSWWVYASALTDVDYSITVLDTHTEASRTYTNNPARPFCGFGDISAFPE